MQRLIWVFCFVLITGSVSGTEEDQWHRLNHGEVTLYCHKEDLYHGELIFEMLSKSLPKMMSTLQMETLEEIRIVLAPNEQYFHKLTGGAIPEWGVGAASKTDRIIYLISPRNGPSHARVEQVLMHEMTHILLGIYLNDRELPRWFDEGLAMWISKDARFWDQIRFSRALITGQAVPLDAIDEVLKFRKDKAALAYWESQSAVQYIEDQFGYETIPALLRAVNYSKNWNEAFKSVMQISEASFQDQWMLAMQKRYKWSFILDQRLLLSLFFIVFFLSAYIYKKNQARKQIQLWEDEEKQTLEEI